MSYLYKRFTALLILSLFPVQFEPQAVTKSALTDPEVVIINPTAVIPNSTTPILPRSSKWVSRSNITFHDLKRFQVPPILPFITAVNGSLNTSSNGPFVSDNGTSKTLLCFENENKNNENKKYNSADPFEAEMDFEQWIQECFDEWTKTEKDFEIFFYYWYPVYLKIMFMLGVSAIYERVSS